jgi:hypothetical protein
MAGDWVRAWGRPVEIGCTRKGAAVRGMAGMESVVLAAVLTGPAPPWYARAVRTLPAVCTALAKPSDQIA